MRGFERFDVDGYSARLVALGPPGGSPVVYLHSGFGELGSLPVLEQLAAGGHRVLAPELAGFGQSDPVTDWHRIEDVVFHLRRTLDALGLDRPALVGSSLGGWLAAELAVWFPERVGSLVLVDPVGLRVDGAPVFDLFGARQSETLARTLPHGGDLGAWLAPALDPDDDNALLLHVMRAMETMARIAWNPFFHDPRLAARLPFVEVPALVLWGADDGIVPRLHADVWTSLLPGARLEVIDRCGHLPALEQPAEVASRVLAFLARPRSESPGALTAPGDSRFGG